MKIKLLVILDKGSSNNLTFLLSSNPSFSITTFKKDKLTEMNLSVKRFDMIVYLSKKFYSSDINLFQTIKKSFSIFVPIIAILGNYNDSVEQRALNIFDSILLEKDASKGLIDSYLFNIYKSFQAEKKLSFVNNLISIFENAVIVDDFHKVDKIIDNIYESGVINSVLLNLYENTILGIDFKVKQYGFERKTAFLKSIENGEYLDFIKNNYGKREFVSIDDQNFLQISGLNNAKNPLYKNLYYEQIQIGFLIISSDIFSDDPEFTNRIFSLLSMSIENILKAVIETKIKKESLISSEEILLRGLDNFLAYYILDVDEKEEDISVRFVSRNFSSLTGVKEFNLTNYENWIEVFFENEIENRDQIVKRTVSQSITEDVSVEHLLKGTRWLRIYTELVHLSGKTIVKGVICDISDIKQSELYLKEQKEIAERQNKDKSAFFVDFGYELRTSLNSMLGFSMLLINEDFNNEKRSKFSKIVKESGQKLLKTIDDILVLSKLEVDEVFLDDNVCNVYYFLKDFELKYSKILEENTEIDFIFIPRDSNTELLINTDCKRLKQVFDILITNSLKYTEEGTISIGYDIDKTNQMLIFYVKDTGIGIPDEAKEDIFDKYKQTDYNRINISPGISLAIAKEIVNKMGGEIWFESYLMEGTDFFFSIPLVEATESEASQVVETEVPTDFTFENLKILIAEDNDYAYEYIYELLIAHKVKLTRAVNGEQLMDIIQKKPSYFDIVMLDIKMPKKNGLECFYEIQEKEIEAKIIFQSAFSISYSDEIKINESGNIILRKPIDPDDLLESIKILVNK